jgi:clan AA aspartic protease (TIGR02281 family)
MLKIVSAVAASALVACLVTLPDQGTQIDASSSTPVTKSDRADLVSARICSDNVSAVSHGAKNTAVSRDDKTYCGRLHSSAVGRVPLVGAGGVHVIPVTINGVSGRFVLDTGAAYVSLTSELAAKARIVKFGNQLFKTVGGTVRADVGYADTIAVDQAEAERVIVAVIPRESNPFPEHTDGLLGMTFLARFKIDLSQNGLILTPMQLRTRSFI